jgi:hypothetical protein
VNENIIDVLEECYPLAAWETADELLWLLGVQSIGSEECFTKVRECRAKYGENIYVAVAALYDELDQAPKETK